MGKNRGKHLGRMAAVVLALILLASGCAEPEIEPDTEPSPTQIATQEAEHTEAEAERLSLQRAAEERLAGYLWPRESIQKDILGEEMEFVLYHGKRAGQFMCQPLGRKSMPADGKHLPIAPVFQSVSNSWESTTPNGIVRSWVHGSMRQIMNRRSTIITMTTEAIHLPPAVPTISTFSPQTVRTKAMSLPFKLWWERPARKKNAFRKPCFSAFAWTKTPTF